MTKLKQCKTALEEKLETVTQLDSEILDSVEEGEVKNEIEQAEMFKEKVQRAIVDATGTIAAKETPATEPPSVVTTSPTIPAPST